MLFLMKSAERSRVLGNSAKSAVFMQERTAETLWTSVSYKQLMRIAFRDL